MNDFDNHVIRSRVKAEGFGSWLLQARYHDGKGWEGSLWCRITAADRYLRVSGDFEPIIFAYGPADPRACVEWMGKEQHLSHYAVEKARIGSGRDACTSENTDDAREDIAERIADLREEIAAELESDLAELATTGGRACSDDPPLPDDAELLPNAEVERLENKIKTWQEGLAVYDDYGGREGVHMILHAVHDSDAGRESLDSESLIGIGARPSSELKFAHAAVRRLHELLAAEDAEWFNVDSEEAAARIVGKFVLVDAPAVDGRLAHPLHGSTTRFESTDVGYLRSHDCVAGLSWAHRGNVRVKMYADPIDFFAGNVFTIAIV